MKHLKYTVLALSMLPLLAGAISVDVNTEVKISAERMAQVKLRADSEIDRRIIGLNALKVRVGEMKRVSDGQKSSLSAQIDAQISAMTALNAKIAADTDAATLRNDVKSIASSYRIFILIMPQIKIQAAADRINTVGDSLSTISAKLNLRITEAKNAGSDTASLEASLTDMNAKIADSKVRANAATTAASSLTPDNGDKAKMDANHAALVAARADLKVGTDDLKTARDDARKIVKGLKEIGIKAKINADTSSTVQQ